MFKRIVSLSLAICLILSCFIATDRMIVSADAATNDYGLVDDVQDGQILQCWNWSFNNIKSNMAKIAAQGFSAIQTSPIQASKESTKEYYSTAGNSFWVYYQPINFSIETNSRSALGTKDEFKAMCEEAEKYGIKVIVDTVFNHLANGTAGNTLNSQTPSDIRDDSSCWHTVTTNISNYSNRYDITHNCLTGLPDLNTGSSKIQNYAIGFLKECIDCGADGFRFDAAKHIETPSDSYGTGSDFWPNVLNAATSYAESTYGVTPYYYGEILDSPCVDITAYTKYMSVTCNNSSNGIRNAVNSGNAGGAVNSYISNGAQPKYTVQWNESHDTYAEGSSTNVSETTLKKTWALVGSRSEVCGMYLARPSSKSTMLGNADVTGWADQEVKAINQFKNAFVGQSEYFSSSGSIAYNERGTSGVVLVNVSGGSTNVSVTANKMAAGTYTDAITGNKFTVSNGKITGNIGSTGIAVVYNPSDIPEVPTQDTTPTTAPTNPELSGDTKTVYVGVISYIDSVPTLHYWNDSNVVGDATLSATGETAKYSVGSEYWSNAEQTFNVYKAEIPVEATAFKTYDASTSSNWAFEDVTYSDGKITLVFEWGGTYHNLTADYSEDDPTEEPTEKPTEEPTEKPTEEPTEKPTEEPTEEPTQADSDTKTVYVGVIEYIKDTLSLHYWNYDGLNGDATLIPTNKTVEYSVGSSYWANAAQTFNVYKTEIPAEATDMKTYNASTNANWAAESVAYADDQILLAFEWGGTHHNVTADYTAEEEPTVKPSEDDTVKIVKNISANSDQVSVTLKWDALDGAIKYWVYKYSDSTDEYACVGSTTSTSYTMSGLSPDTAYKFKVCYNGSDYKISSLDEAQAVTVSTLKAADITEITGTPGLVTAEISWGSVAGATKYWIYKAWEENGPFYCYDATTATEYTVRRLQADTDYYFKVITVVESNGKSVLSKLADAPTLHVKTEAAERITVKLDNINKTSATISWPAFENAEKYWIKYSNTTKHVNLEDEWVTYDVTTDTSYTFKNLKPNTTYYFTVVAKYPDPQTGSEVANYIAVDTKTWYSEENFFTFEKKSTGGLTVSWPEDVNSPKSWMYVYDKDGNLVVSNSTTTNSVSFSFSSDWENYTYALKTLDADSTGRLITPELGFSFR